MIYRDPKCVFVGDKMGLAEVVATWLREHDIPAQVMNPRTLGGLQGLTPWSSTGVSAAGIEVWVLDPADAERARQLVAEHEQARAAQAELAASSGPAEAVCEECGKTSTHPAAQRGTVQECPHCGEYLDVPDADSALEMVDEEQSPDSDEP